MSKPDYADCQWCDCAYGADCRKELGEPCRECSRQELASELLVARAEVRRLRRDLVKHQDTIARLRYDGVLRQHAEGGEENGP